MTTTTTGRSGVGRAGAMAGAGPGSLPLPTFLVAGVALLGSLGAGAQTVSSRLGADVPVWLGIGFEDSGRGGLGSDSRGVGGGQGDGVSSPVGGPAMGSVPGLLPGYSDLMGRGRLATPRGLLDRVHDMAVEWLDPNSPLGIAQHEAPVYAAASASAGGGGPLFVDVGTHRLQPNTPGQWLTLTARNETAAAVVLSGLNFNVQIADSGPVSEGGFGVIDGPNITQVDLVTGTVFAGNHTGTTPAAGNVPQGGLWTVATLTGTLSIGPGESVTLARIEIDTRGFHAADSWDLSLTARPPGGLLSTTSFVQAGADGWVDAVDIRFNPGLVTVPEPHAIAGAVGVGLAAWGLLRRTRRGQTQAHR